MSAHYMITAEVCRELFEYSDGVLYWKARPSAHSRRRAGDAAGTRLATGYWRIKVGGRMYLRHRLIWLMHHDQWPLHQIDHINRTPGDDRIENLRDATPSQNQWNRDTNVGVIFVDGGWRAQIKAHRKWIYLGRRRTEAEARELYMAGKAIHHAGV